MAISEQLEILRSGAENWNAWRKENPKVKIDLSGAKLIKASLEGANLTHVDLSRANLSLAKLDGANLAFCNLRRAVLSFASFKDADLRAANLKRCSADDADFSGANLTRAYLRKAELAFSNLKSANLSEAKLNGANLSAASLVDAKTHGVHYDSGILRLVLKESGYRPKKIKARLDDLMLDTTLRCKGVNASGCHGSQKFKVFLQDQDYLEEMLEGRKGRRLCFVWWLMANCGRSVARWSFWCLVLVLFYTFLYYFLGKEHFRYDSLEFGLLSIFYYSGVIFTTLGFGDILPKDQLAAMLALSEGVMGYIMLGGLISIFNNKLARRGV